MTSSDIFYGFAAIYILFRFYFIFKKGSVQEEVVEISVTDVKGTMKNVADPFLLVGLLNLTWLIAGLWSSQKMYFIFLLVVTFLPALFMFREQQKHRLEGHFIFLSIIKIMIAAHIFIMNFFF